ncbi:DUF6207 family protein [Streptomyces mirabilis]
MPQGPHLAQPGIARITIHALDEETAVAVGFALAEHSNVTGPSAPYRIPGKDGVCAALPVRCDRRDPLTCTLRLQCETLNHRCDRTVFLKSFGRLTDA